MIVAISILLSAAVMGGGAPAEATGEAYLFTSCALTKLDLGTKEFVGKPGMLAFYFPTAAGTKRAERTVLKDPQNILMHRAVTDVQVSSDVQVRIEAKSKEGEGFEFITVNPQRVDNGAFVKAMGLMRFVPQGGHPYRYGGECFTILTMDPEAQLADITKAMGDEK